MDFSAQLIGAKELQAALKQLPPAIERRALASAVRAGATVVKREIAARAPVRQEPGVKVRVKGKRGTLPGYLRAAIAVVRAPGHRLAAPSYDIGALASAFWVRFVELGTARMAARPFIRPGFEAAVPEAIKRMRDALAKAIAREAAKLAKPMTAAARRRTFR